MKSTFLSFSGFFTILLTLTFSTAGQNYDLNGIPALDPKVKSGVLDNGMHYYIRSNKLPERRGEFFLVNNVGAIEENDDQNGLAHFTEHMAFNGTKNFPGKGILDYLATIGVKFGTNVNAGTGIAQTIYNLSNVPLSREGIIDTALLILHDWAHYVSFVPREIDLERGVIREEWRMYGSADERMNNELAPVIYKGSKYARRNVIGDTSVINHFAYKTLIDFYNKWYRPDLQAIVVVGDFDENKIEATIKKLFNSIPRVQNPLPKEIYPLPDNTEPLIGTATDKEATSTSVNVSFKHNAVKDSYKNLNFMRLQIIRNLINNMFGQRMNEISRTENPPFLNAYSYYRTFTKTKDAFTGTATSANNEAIRALSALLIEMERLKLFGFTTGEYERAKANVMRNYESRYLDRDKRKNRELVYPCVSNYLVNNPNPGIEFEYQFAKTEMPGITLEEINSEAKKYVRDDNEIITITGPEKEGITIPSIQEIQQVLATYRSNKIDPYIDNITGKKLIEKDPVPGKIIKTSANPILGTSELILSNGMKVIYKPTDIKEDELIIKGYGSGGQSLLKDDEVIVAGVIGSVVDQMGISSFSRTDLNKLLAGKRINLNIGIMRDQDVINVRTSPKDLETSLQLINLYYTNPRWNETDYITWMDKMRAMYINAESEPRKAFSDTITVMMTDHNRRTIPMTYKLLDEITFEKIKSVYSQRFSDPGNFTFQFIGKINPEELHKMIEKYLASLPVQNRKDTYKDDGIHAPSGHLNNDFKRENKTPRTSVFIDYNGTCNYSADDRLFGAAIRHILELRYVESIREDEGGTYSVRISYNIDKNPVPWFMMNVVFDTDPLKADKLVGIVHREVEKLVENGPSETDLQKAKEYFIKQRQEDMKENNWWNNILTDYYFYDLDYLTGYENKVKALDVNSVHDYAKKVLSQGNIIEVIMRPQ